MEAFGAAGEGRESDRELRLELLSQAGGSWCGRSLEKKNLVMSSARVAGDAPRTDVPFTIVTLLVFGISGAVPGGTGELLV